jgi:hypothetical protein
MGSMEAWDVALLVAAGYVAVSALVRLMLRRRDEMVAKFREELRRETARRSQSPPAGKKAGEKRAA